jgi:hypothetical protein
MEELTEIAGPPTFYDWSDTAVMLQDIAHGVSFEELTGLDRMRWAVVGVDLRAGTASGARPGLAVYAIDLRRWDVSEPERRRNALARPSVKTPSASPKFSARTLALAMCWRK